MFDKIKAFLYRVTHASGRILGLKADLGPFSLSLWVGRMDGDAVSFAADVTFNYYARHPMLNATVAVGVIEVELSLTRSRLE